MIIFNCPCCDLVLDTDDNMFMEPKLNITLTTCLSCHKQICNNCMPNYNNDEMRNKLSNLHSLAISIHDRENYNKIHNEINKITTNLCSCKNCLNK